MEYLTWLLMLCPTHTLIIDVFGRLGVVRIWLNDYFDMNHSSVKSPPLSLTPIHEPPPHIPPMCLGDGLIRWILDKFYLYFSKAE